jgi:hypothetical protein
MLRPSRPLKICGREAPWQSERYFTITLNFSGCRKSENFGRLKDCFPTTTHMSFRRELEMLLLALPDRAFKENYEKSETAPNPSRAPSAGSLAMVCFRNCGADYHSSSVAVGCRNGSRIHTMGSSSQYMETRNEAPATHQSRHFVRLKLPLFACIPKRWHRGLLDFFTGKS